MQRFLKRIVGIALLEVLVKKSVRNLWRKVCENGDGFASDATPSLPVAFSNPRCLFWAMQQCEFQGGCDRCRKEEESCGSGCQTGWFSGRTQFFCFHKLRSWYVILLEQTHALVNFVKWICDDVVQVNLLSFLRKLLYLAKDIHALVTFVKWICDDVVRVNLSILPTYSCTHNFMKNEHAMMLCDLLCWISCIRYSIVIVNDVEIDSLTCNDFEPGPTTQSHLDLLELMTQQNPTYMADGNFFISSLFCSLCNTTLGHVLMLVPHQL